MAIALEHMGYSRFIDKNKTSNLLDHKIKSNNKKYAVITSSSQELFSDVGNEKNIENILNIVNSDENLDGELLKIILITKKASEGLSFMNVREIHILDPWYHFNRNEQIIGEDFVDVVILNYLLNLEILIYLHIMVLLQIMKNSHQIYMY